MNSKNRILNRDGFTAVLAPYRMVLGLTCLMSLALTGCPGPNQPMTDSGMPPDDGGMPPPDSDVPPPDSGMPPDDGGTDAGMVGECTPSMMEMRVTPPCDPDTRTGAGTGPTGLEEFVGPGTGWASSSGSCLTGQGPDAMGRILLEMACNETRNVDPYYGLFYYDRDGLWYANWQNRATQEHARMSFDSETGHDIATIELFHAGEDTPYQTVIAAR